LANPSAIQKYSGLKHADHVHDAFCVMRNQVPFVPEKLFAL